MLNWIAKEVSSPTPYGVVHIIWAVVIIALIAFVLKFFKNTTHKQNKILLLCTATLITVSEILKQLAANLTVDGKWVEEYYWFTLPIVPCSFLLYTIWVVTFLDIDNKSSRRQKLIDISYLFIACYGFFSGLTALLVPHSIFDTPKLIIIINTMIFHGLYIVIGVYLFWCGRAKVDHKNFLLAQIIFLIWFVVAAIANLIVNNMFPDIYFNAIFISPNYAPEIPIVSVFYEHFPWIVWVVVYYIGYTLSSYIIMLFAQCLSIAKKFVQKNS
ncbi:MAG: YwaF family protein [Firmicutes bacterium]|nr:YwaF family protein [Bacillota bacterium]MCL1953307.1 YwaF family protein [Bacillota bacterium]